MAKAAVKSAADTTLVITRIFDAPLERVYRAWSDLEETSKWLGPGGWNGRMKSADMRPGGSYRIEMKHTDGDEVCAVGTYREVVPRERLVYTWAWLDADGEPGLETLVTVTFRAVGKKTEITLKHEGFAEKQARDNHESGWNGCLDKLAAYLQRENG